MVPAPNSRRARTVAAFLLAWTAGFVDAFGYLFLARVFTSHMSGNSSSLALFSVLGDWRQAAWHGWPLALFFAGTLLGAVMKQRGWLRGRSALRWIFVLEIALLAAFGFLAARYGAGGVLDARGALRWLVVATPALAMGLQTVTLSRLGDLPLHTTYVTGALTLAGESCASWLLSFAGAAESRAARRAQGSRRAALAGGVWFSFLVGAASGAAAKALWRFAALVAPIAVLVVVLVIRRGAMD